MAEAEMSTASAISRRFELLESQWMDFQRRSATPDLDEEQLEFAASGNASPVASQATGKAKASMKQQDSFEFGRKRSEEQPDSPLSSSSTLSSTSSSSSSSSRFLQSDFRRRRGLFSEPHTPIKEAILDSSLVKSSPKERTKPVKPQTPGSRSPPPGLAMEEAAGLGTHRDSFSLKRSTPRSLRKIATRNASTTVDDLDVDPCNGNMVVGALRDSLVQVLEQLELKERHLRDAWKTRNGALEFIQRLKQWPELESLVNAQETTFTGLPEENSPARWSVVVSDVCKRLSSSLGREMLLQKWIIALEEVEVDLAEKVVATENMSKKLVSREKVLNELQTKAEKEKRRIQESLQNLEREKRKLHVSEVESELSKKNAQETLLQVAEERKRAKKAEDRLKATEDKLKAWEENLENREKELQRQEGYVKDLEAEVVQEQERAHTMHAKLVKDQEAILAEEDDLKRKEMAAANRAAELRRELEKLNRERKQVAIECKRLMEMETKVKEAEKVLEIKEHEQVEKMRKQAEEYQFQAQALDAARNELDQKAGEMQKRFHQLYKEKVDFEKYKKQAQEELEHMFREKDDLCAQHEKLTTLQREIENAAAAMIDHVIAMDKASAKLEEQSHRIESSERHLQHLAGDLLAKQKDLKEREKELASKEGRTQSEIKKLKEELSLKEKFVSSREREVQASRRSLQELETKLAKEKEALQKMEKTLNERSKALAKAENVLDEEKSSKERNFRREKEHLAEQAENLSAKRKETVKLEAALKKKEQVMEEQSSTLLKLEVELKERMGRIEHLDKSFEKKSSELERGSEKLKEERETLFKEKNHLASVRAHYEELAASQKVERQRLTKEKEELSNMKGRLDKQQIEAEQLKEALSAKEVKAAERESTLDGMENKLLTTRNQVEKDAEELRVQLAKAHTELEAQKRYVEERQKAVDAAVFSLKEVATKVNARKKAVEEREQLVHCLEEKHRLSSLNNMQDATHGLFDAPITEFGGFEAASLVKERENLKAQQLELEKTKQAVQEAKETLTMQLKASKKMIADASLIAQNASSEREALEKERRLVEKKKREMESSLAEKEKQIIAEERRLASMKTALEKQVESKLPEERRQEVQTEASDEWKIPELDQLRREETLLFDELRDLRRWSDGEQVAETEDDIKLKNNFLLLLKDYNAGNRPMEQLNTMRFGQQMMPSQQRLENVMSSLLDARQASRSRLQRTENALRGLPLSSPSTMEVKGALRELAARLSDMEQVEEGLACQLREAYEAEFPELEGAIVDKVELLCKMEEQQNLRAEWEQDMQKQLEKLSRLQATSPSADTYANMMSMEESVERVLSPMIQRLERNQRSGTVRRQLENELMASPDWRMTFGTYEEEVSASPLIDYPSESPARRNLAPRKLL